MRYVILILLITQLMACSLLSPVKTMPVNTYTLAISPTDALMRPQRSQQVLLITAPTAAPGYQTTNMVYTQRPFELSSFAHNRWTAPPAEMLAPLLAQNLQASGCFHAVVSPPFPGNIDLTLDTRLLNLQQEFKGDSSQVRLALQLTLSNNNTHEVLVNQRVEAVVPTTENNPYAGVIAANKATDIVLVKIKKLVCRY